MFLYLSCSNFVAVIAVVEALFFEFVKSIDRSVKRKEFRAKRCKKIRFTKVLNSGHRAGAGAPCRNPFLFAGILMKEMKLGLERGNRNALERGRKMHISFSSRDCCFKLLLFHFIPCMPSTILSCSLSVLVL
jgi:hypothetical protein